MFHTEETGNKRSQYKRNVTGDIIHSRKFRNSYGLLDMAGYSQYSYIVDEIKSDLYSL